MFFAYQSCRFGDQDVGWTRTAGISICILILIHHGDECWGKSEGFDGRPYLGVQRNNHQLDFKIFQDTEIEDIPTFYFTCNFRFNLGLAIPQKPNKRNHMKSLNFVGMPVKSRRYLDPQGQGHQQLIALVTSNIWC